LALGLALTGCSDSAEDQAAGAGEAVDKALAASVEADLRNVATQVTTWMATGQAMPTLVAGDGKHYLCAAADVSNLGACTVAGPVGSGAKLSLSGSGADSFCLEATLDSSDAWHQGPSGAPEQGPCP
jgi:hypothetical protein